MPSVKPFPLSHVLFWSDERIPTTGSIAVLSNDSSALSYPEKWTLLISNRPAVGRRGRIALVLFDHQRDGHPVTIELYRLMRELRRICTPA